MTSKLKPLHEQTIVIMGASSGIGLATAEKAAERGANVVLVSRNGDALERICQALRKKGGRADYVVADVGVREQVRNVVDTVISRHGGFDTAPDSANAARRERDKLRTLVLTTTLSLPVPSLKM